MKQHSLSFIHSKKLAAKATRPQHIYSISAGSTAHMYVFRTLTKNANNCSYLHESHFLQTETKRLPSSWNIVSQLDLDCIRWGGGGCVFTRTHVWTYPSEDSQMSSSLLKSRLGSRSWGNSSSSLSSCSPAAGLRCSAPATAGMRGSTGSHSRLCWAVEDSVSSDLWSKVSVEVSTCRTIVHIYIYLC